MSTNSDEQIARTQAPETRIDHARVDALADPKTPRLWQWRPRVSWQRYGLCLSLIAATTLLGAPFASHIAATNMVMLYLVPVVVAAIYLGRGPSIVAAVTGVLALDFFFVPPQFTFAVSDTQYLLTFAGFLIVGLVISTLMTRVREQAEAAQRREMQTTEIYELSRDLAAAVGVEEILHAVQRHVGQTFGQVVVLLPSGTVTPGTASEDGALAVRISSPGFELDGQDLSTATWTFEHGESAGHTTAHFPQMGIRFMPLKAAHGVVGVLGIKPLDPAILLAPEQGRLLESFASQSALAIERAQYAEQARRAQVLQATEKLQTALLNSISHDLRTPLVSVTGTLSSLLDDSVELDDATRDNMVETAYDEARRLNHLVGNLLDMTRLEAGAMQTRQEPCDVQDVIGSALEQLSDRLRGHQVTVDLPATLPLVPMDFVLIVQVLVNLVENASKYSPPTSPIEIRVHLADGYLEIQVADAGVGIPRQDLTRVFDKFYRVRRPDGVTGTGLGLSICKGIVELHRGKIRADNREGGGTIFTVDLPVSQPAGWQWSGNHERA